MFKGEKKKLIIVCDSQTKVFANQLSQLISANDDTENEVIGSKDSSIVASVWEEKYYLDNEAKISSDQDIIFIGTSKSSKSVIPNITEKLNQYGIHYGWLGHKAVIYVEDKLLKKDEYDNFNEFCRQQQKEFEEKVKLNNLNTKPTNIKEIVLLLNYIYPITIFGIISNMKAKKKIMKQQYNMAVYHFYMTALNTFLED
ncbi:hypothetical protein [Paenisporosarcina sp. TG-14]|uniref:hypothetical protein n=1 Tax=Paenisporosarcina sp. TG-14 TaxID=1231057 RepID=UPI000300E0F8|nr:hypothetical protein [Paenisporosarcina sp. TG-14]